jgi:hypothetical protein
MLLGTLRGIHRSHGKYHVATTGSTGISGMKTSTSVNFVLNFLSL